MICFGLLHAAQLSDENVNALTTILVDTQRVCCLSHCLSLCKFRANPTNYQFRLLSGEKKNKNKNSSYITIFFPSKHDIRYKIFLSVDTFIANNNIIVSLKTIGENAYPGDKYYLYLLFWEIPFDTNTVLKKLCVIQKKNFPSYNMHYTNIVNQY